MLILLPSPNRFNAGHCFAIQRYVFWSSCWCSLGWGILWDLSRTQEQCCEWTSEIEESRMGYLFAKLGMFSPAGGFNPLI